MYIKKKKVGGGKANKNEKPINKKIYWYTVN